MRIRVAHRCGEALSYRAARVKALFNVESGASVQIDADLPFEGEPWSIGVVVGPSGSGKSSIGREIFGPAALWQPDDWPTGAPIIDAIAPAAPFDDVVGALSAVGLGTVPTWLRPHNVLSTGERFRADLARLVCEAPAQAVVDEFSSVVDRQVAQVASHAFAKAWRRTGGQVVLLSCHYDILDWLEPDWVYETRSGRFGGRWLRRRPAIELDVYETGWEWWPVFEPHHYLKPPQMIAATCYVGFVGDEPVCHAAVSTTPGLREGRIARVVVMPEWQGLGIGTRFVTHVAGLWRRGLNPYGRAVTSLLHTSHPGFARTLRSHPLWAQVSQTMIGANKVKSSNSITASRGKASTGYGGHFRGIQGVRYVEGL